MTVQIETKLTEAARQAIQSEVAQASRQWIASFNRGDAEACADAYAEQAVMNAMPMGRYVGREAILGFWKPFLESGAGDLVYTNVQMDVLDPQTVCLSADWSMNIGQGVITNERWVKQPDGRWLLEEDDFEVQSANR